MTTIINDYDDLYEIQFYLSNCYAKEKKQSLLEFFDENISDDLFYKFFKFLVKECKIDRDFSYKASFLMRGKSLIKTFLKICSLSEDELCFTISYFLSCCAYKYSFENYKLSDIYHFTTYKKI